MNEIKIKAARNGFALETEDECLVFENDRDSDNDSSDLTALVGLLHQLIDMYGTSSRYSEERLMVLRIPGDKYIGKIPTEVKENLEYVKGLITSVLGQNDG